MHDRIRDLQRRVDLLERDVDRLSGWIELLLEESRLLETSRTWKIGRRVVESGRLVLGRSTAADPFGQTEELREIFEHWKKSRD